MSHLSSNNTTSEMPVISGKAVPSGDEMLSVERGGRQPTGRAGYAIVLLALGWSLFQLYAAVVPINDTLVRSLHLAFAMALAYLAFPMRNSSPTRTIPMADWILAVVATLGAAYLFLDYQGIALRPGLPLTRDLVIGSVTLLLLLEAARRTLGPALAIIGTLFLAYCHFGPHMPELIAHRGASLAKLISHMVLTTEGIYGVPIRVSASFVFLFVLFGTLLEKAGGGRYFIAVAYAALGRFRGGPAKAAVAASGLTGMVSGSSIANTVTTGTFTIPLMKKVGLSPEKAAAVEVAASTNGQLMPPIMGAAAFIMSEFLGIAYLDVVKAAIIPAFVSYLGLFYVVHLESCRLGLRGVPRAELPTFWGTLLRGAHFLIPVAVLIYTLAVLQRSATSAALYATLSMMIIMVVQHPLRHLLGGRLTSEGRGGPIQGGMIGDNHAESGGISMAQSFRRGLNELLSGLVDGARNMVPIAVATAAAGIVVGSITLTGLGQRLLEVIDVIAMGEIGLILLLTALTSLILGMGLPTTANYIVMASLTAPVIVGLGAANGLLVPAIAAHLFVFYFGILADDTPPVGLAAYAASGIARSDPIRTGIQGFTYDLRTAILPFMFIFNTRLILIEGVIPGGSPMDGTAWIWISDWGSIGWITLTAMLGMFAFASAVVGWHIGAINVLQRLLLLLLAVALMRPDMVVDWLPSWAAFSGSVILDGAFLPLVIYLGLSAYRAYRAK